MPLKSGKDKTAYKLFGTRWKVPRISFAAHEHAQVFGGRLASRLINPLIALIAGILILLMPRLLNYVVAIYLIAIGIIGLMPHFQ